MDAWPKKYHLVLSGATFDHLGGHQGETERDMLPRGADWWDGQWARLDLTFSPSIYEQIAAAFAAAGDRNAADEIHYAEQVRAEESDEQNERWLDVARSRLLRLVGGYGIGYYAFRSFYWALALALLGSVMLRFRVKGIADARHGFLWCFGASFNRLLPAVTLQKQFAHFFDKPELNQFTPGQEFFFNFLSILGWVVGGFVVAAITSITRGP
jgi:hypothetical protein